MPLRKRSGSAPDRPINAPAYEREMLTLGLKDIKPHPKNVNIGDMDAIAESIEELGMFDPLIWNRRNGMLVTGHHTWLSTRKMGWTSWDVIVVDVDEETHVRMMLSHNAVAAKGRREEYGLANILRELEQAGATRGTGYTDAEVRSLVERTSRELEQIRSKANQVGAAAKLDLDETDLPELESTTEPGGALDDDFDKLSGELGGIYTLKQDVVFDGVGEWDIPTLLPDMIPTHDELPHDLLAWAGSATRDWPNPDQYWLYNIKVDSTSGMRDLSKMIPAFYVYDAYIEVWWQKAAQMTARVLESGCQYIVSPDFSPHSVGAEARIGSLWNLFRNRWMARYFQQAGLKVIPNINWSLWDEQFLIEHTLPTMPMNPNMIAIQIQTATTQARDKELVAAQAADFGRQVQLVLDTLQPGGLLCYYGKVGRELFEEHVKTDVPIIWVAGRTNMLGDKGKRNMRKRTL